MNRLASKRFQGQARGRRREVPQKMKQKMSNSQRGSRFKHWKGGNNCKICPKERILLTLSLLDPLACRVTLSQSQIDSSLLCVAIGCYKDIKMQRLPNKIFKSSFKIIFFLVGPASFFTAPTFLVGRTNKELHRNIWKLFCHLGSLTCDQAQDYGKALLLPDTPTS